MAKEPKSDKSSGKESPPERYEEVVQRLEEVVHRLEDGQLSLEDSLKAFEDGIRLVQKGEKLLGDAEKRIEQLLAGEGTDRAVPLEQPAQGAGRPAPRAEEKERPKPPAATKLDEEDDVPF